MARADSSAANEPVLTLDLSSWFNYGYGDQISAANLDTRRVIYDTTTAAAALQGIVNRSAPRFYLYFFPTPANGDKGVDALWLERMQGPEGAHLLDGRAVMPVADIDAALEHYRSEIRGLAVWDENVPATLNAAFTAAGVEDLIPVRWDASPTSLYQRLLARGYPEVISLVHPDGSSRFVSQPGDAMIPDTSRPTSHSAKVDAHLWTLERYLKTGKLDPTEFGLMVDGFWIQRPLGFNTPPTNSIAPFNLNQVVNHDWQVARRGFAYDLSVFDNIAPDDDPGQPVGADVSALREILGEARRQAGDQVISIRGFPAWPFKYFNQGDRDVANEINTTKVISAFGAGLDADAWGPTPSYTNASFYAHVPLAETPEPQRRPTPEDLVGNGYLAGLAQNGGFEDGEEGWVMNATGHRVYTDPSKTHGGARLLQIHADAVGDPAQDNIYRDGSGVAAGVTVTARAFVRAQEGPVDAELVIWAGLGAAQQKATISFTAGPEWSEQRTSLVMGSAAGMATRVQLILHTPAKNLDVDDVAFYAGDPATAPVVPATYNVWFVGDWDAAGGMYSNGPERWDAPGRGQIPMAWDFSGHVQARMPLFTAHVLATRTPRDFFISADSGAGYGNPSQMDAATRALWAEQGTRDARVLDESMGWLLDPFSPDLDHIRAMTPFDPDGMFLQQGGLPGLVDNVPTQFLDNAPDFRFDTAPASDLVNATHTYFSPANASAPTFHALREVFWKTQKVVDATVTLIDSYPQLRYRFVDPYTFMYLKRHALGGDNTHRASYASVVRPASVEIGKPAHITFVVRNDGWETWRAGGPNRYRAGFNVSAKPPALGELPNIPTAYPTRVDLPNDVPPGAEVALAVDLPAMDQRGDYVVQLDMVEEGHTWFETAGDIPTRFTLHVVPVGAGGNGDGDGGHLAGCGCSSGNPVDLGFPLGLGLWFASRRRRRAWNGVKL